ncbi:hypothetical protein GQ53DRAFT_783334 [Thozetella sp. PMI_491]|nr:hypothetical protein GQ53DRAFT_783334 [Thozetella sp. PMI_491]
MARKGAPKVKTGCLTCKARKVKCDETKPHCLKCITSHRKCDGYATPAETLYCWSRLLTSRTILPPPSIGRSSREGRALDFFYRVAAPGLSIYPDEEFWTRLVPAACQQEPAVRDAAIAVSILFQARSKDQLAPPGSPTDVFAMCHYNRALASSAQKSTEAPAMLLLCILFVCIEWLRADAETAIEHCRHGVLIMNSSVMPPWAKDYIVPMFVRLSVFPYFFGSTVATFPPINGLTPDSKAPFSTLAEASAALDTLVAIAIRFIRSTETYKQGTLSRMTIPKHLHREQALLLQGGEKWLQDFSVFKSTHPPPTNQKRFYTVALIEALVSKIWVAQALDRTETGYDQHSPAFEAIVGAAKEIVALAVPAESATEGLSYWNGMSYLPLLYFVVIKCRTLDIRLEAFDVMGKLACSQEGLWNRSVMLTIGRRVIELEHRISFDDLDRDGSPEANLEVPPDELRIRDTTAAMILWTNGSK